jgi:phage terminase large subunit GpA-like protein
MKLWPYQEEIANAIGDPHVERVVLVKAARIGFTSLLTAADALVRAAVEKAPRRIPRG